jgi:hypothetical protein
MPRTYLSSSKKTLKKEDGEDQTELGSASVYAAETLLASINYDRGSGESFGPAMDFGIPGGTNSGKVGRVA